MKAATWSFVLEAVLAGSALLTTDAAMAQPAGGKAQPAQPPTGGEVQPSSVPVGTAQPTTSNRWETLPAMSADRCLAEALGTAADPKTGAPVRASVDPQTGKPVCPTPQPTTKPR